MVGQIDSKALQLQISASSELLVRNLRAADQAVAQFRGATDRNLTLIDARFAQLGRPLGLLKSTLAGLGGGALAGLAGIAGGASLIALAKSGLEYASSLQEVSQQLGTTAKGLQELRFAATQVGVDQETLEKGLQKLTRTMGDAGAGAKEPTKAFAALGISIADLKGKTSDELLPSIAESLSKISSPAERAAVEVALFGKAGQQLDPLLTQGASGLKAFADQAERLGLVLSARQIQDADNAADKLAEVKKVLEANISKAVADNANAILTLADALEAAAVKAVQFGANIAGAYRIARDEGLKSLILNHDHADVVSASTDSGYALLRKQSLDKALATYRAAKARGDKPSVAGANPIVNGLVSGVSAAQRAFGGTGIAPAAGVPTLDEARAALVKEVGLARAAANVVSAGKSASALARAQILNGGTGSTGQFKAPEGSKGKTAEQLADEAARNEKSYISDEARAADQLASVRSQLVNTADTRLSIELDRIKAAREARDVEIDETAKLNPVVAAQAAHLHEINDQTAEAKKQVEIAKRDTDNAQASLDLRLSGYDDERTVADLQATMALTIAQRRDAEKRLLDITMREERDRLQTQKENAARNGDSTAAALAQRQMDGLPDRYSAQSAQIDKRNQGPLGDYKDRLHAATDDMSAALEGVEAHGLQSLEDGLVGIIDGTESVSSAFKKMAASIIADLARIAIEKAILGAIGGSTGGGLFSSLFGGGKASGGAVDGSKFYVVGERGPEIFAPGVSGNIIPNHALRTPQIGNLAGASLQRVAVMTDVNVKASPLFHAEVENVSLRTVAAAADPIMTGARAQTLKALGKPKMPGGYGG